jgi:hypothetical protein
MNDLRLISNIFSVLNVIKLFTVVIYEYSYKARVFVPGRPFQSSLIFAGKDRSIP